eukprot:scaffold295555_cov28-Tisochrysis_lutea.AAC.4
MRARRKAPSKRVNAKASSSCERGPLPPPEVTPSSTAGRSTESTGAACRWRLAAGTGGRWEVRRPLEYTHRGWRAIVGLVARPCAHRLKSSRALFATFSECWPPASAAARWIGGTNSLIVGTKLIFEDSSSNDE